MADPDSPANRPRSVVLAAEKARAQRMIRIQAALTQKLENPIPIVDALMGELAEGEPHTSLWEALHASAAKGGVEARLADAYQKCIVGPRMKKLPPEDQAEVLMHAADFSIGVLGDMAATEDYLARVLKAVPGHLEAFTRLERRLEKLLDARRLLELYAGVAVAPPKAPAVLATQVFNRVLQLQPAQPLAEEACRQLLVLLPTNPRVLDALDQHCKATKRPALACALFEQAIAAGDVPEAAIVSWRHRLLELYTGEANAPDRAMPHAEELLKRDPADERAFKVAEKLLSSREMGSRAAGALREARRARGY